jgi:hypothetical protein
MSGRIYFINIIKMQKPIILISILPFLFAGAFPQMSKQQWDSTNRLSSEDHALMMKQLGITTIRPGPSGNPQAPNAANTDESRASPFTSLPDNGRA